MVAEDMGARSPDDQRRYAIHDAHRLGQSGLAALAQVSITASRLAGSTGDRGCPGPRPKVELARDGRIQVPLWRRAISENDMREALRRVGVENVSETRLIALEPSGKISVLKAR